MSRLSQTASRGALPASFGIWRRSCSPVEDGSVCIEVVDAVAVRQEPRRGVSLAVRTLRLQPWGGSEPGNFRNENMDGQKGIGESVQGRFALK